MSLTTAQQALALWDLQDATLTLIAQRENVVYRVDDSNTQQTWVLRLHREGLRSKHELISEFQWIKSLSDGGLSVPVPIDSKNGRLCEDIDGTWVDLQSWLPGDTLSQHLTTESYRALGNAMARLHSVSDEWILPSNFQRPAWNRYGLVGDSPVWGPFWCNPQLNDEQRLSCEYFRNTASKALLEQQSTLDYGLIHADLVTDNVLVNDQQLHLIDFDDSGYGYRLFDLATVILRVQRESEHITLTNALIEGYATTRALDLKTLDLFLALRACTYVGWIIPRLNEQAGTERCARFIKIACIHIDKWVNTHST